MSPKFASDLLAPQASGGNVEPARVNTAHTEVHLEAKETPQSYTLLAYLPHLYPRGGQYLYYIGQETKLSSDPGRDIISSFQGHLQCKQSGKGCLDKRCHKMCSNAMENYLPTFCRNDRSRWKSEEESKESTKVLRRRDHVSPLLQPQGRGGRESLRLLPLHPLKFQDRYTGFPRCILRLLLAYGYPRIL